MSHGKGANDTNFSNSGMAGGCFGIVCDASCGIRHQGHNRLTLARIDTVLLFGRTDSYFINHPDSEKITIFAEGRKKEVRTEPGAFMTFKKFVENYNSTDMYMVNGLPKHLR